MGNELSLNGQLKEKTVLGEYVKDFMLNKYKYKDDVKFDNSLRKRACCRNSDTTPIALPSYDPVTKKVYPTRVDIKIFNKVSDINDGVCTFDNNKFRPQNTEKGVNWNGGGVCNTFYGNFCNAVYKDRQNYNNDYSRLYGSYPDKPTENPDHLAELNVGNQFTDCNCLNSIYIRKIDKLNIQQSGMQPTPATMAQTFDKRCADFAPTDSYVAEWAKKDNITMCVNSINIEGPVTAANKSDIGLDQSCEAKSTNQAAATTGTSSGNSAAVKTDEKTKVADQTSTTTNATAVDASKTTGGSAAPASTTSSSTSSSSGTPGTPASGTPVSGTPASGTPASGTPPIFGTPTSSTSGSPVAAPTGDNSLMYAGIAGGVVFLLILMFVFMGRGGRGKEQSPLISEETEE